MVTRGDAAAVRFLPAGDGGVVVEFGQGISLETNAAVRGLAHALERARIPGLREAVPTYRSLGVEYDPIAIGWDEITDAIRGLLDRIDADAPPSPRRVELPTVYGGAYGPDLLDVAAHTGLAPDEVIRRHSGTDYPVYMLGFTAGFAYLGGLPDSLHTPRLATPRTRVPKGSVAIGGAQTGAYPEETPGGWRLIGRTPVPLFDPLRDPPTPCSPGDRVRFVPVSEEEYRRLEREAATADRTGLAERPLFEVVQPGPLTTVQDGGRIGTQKFGVSAGGAVDGLALRVGNILVGNPAGAAGLEFTACGPTLRFAADGAAALTGGAFAATLDGRPAPWYTSFLVRAGQILTVQGVLRGFRGYLAVAGGVDVPRLLGSRSTCLPARFGGHQGRRLEAGDVLGTGLPAGAAPLGCTAGAAFRPAAEDPVAIRVVLGPQDDAFTAAGRRTFLASIYRVTPEVDRMGCRLDGPPVAHETGADIVSDWIPPGGIQVPGSGMPIVLLSDRQTTGGYAKIATVIGPDLGRIAQCRPGDAVRFQAVSLAEAQRAAREMDAALARLPSEMCRSLLDRA